MNYPNIDAVIKDGVNVGVGGDCVVTASTSYECLVMLVRSNGETFAAMLNPN